MRNTQTAVLNTLVRVQRFLDANQDVLGDINQSGSRTTLAAAVDALSAHAINQTSSKRVALAETAKERVLRNALKLNHMRPIATIAAAQLRQVPEFVALKMPPTNLTTRPLVAAARAMGFAAAKYTTTFVAAGVQSDFVAQLNTAAQAVEDSLSNKGQSRSLLSGATPGLNAEAARGRQAVKVLDALVEPKLNGDLSLLAQWKTARRFSGKSVPVADTTIDAAVKGATPDTLAPAPQPSTSASGALAAAAPEA